MLVEISLKNPPSGAVFWSISLTDQDHLKLLHHVKDDVNEGRLALTDKATFLIPDDWIQHFEYDFPLRVAMLQIKKWKDGSQELLNPGGTIQQLYYVQSFRPYKWDFDKGRYGDDPEPTYRDIQIPDLGTYDYNVQTEKFESTAPVEEEEYAGSIVLKELEYNGSKKPIPVS